MTRSEFLFRAVDVLCDPLQNYKKFKGIVKEKDNVVYDETYPTECVGEIYYDPNLVGEDKPKLPVVLNVHGGGFVKGDMHFRRSISKLFANEGYFVFNINHRLAPKHPFPDSMLDCAKALNYLEVLAGKYNIDLAKVCVTGDSAGAHFAAHMVTMSANPELVERIGADPIKVKPALFVGFCGPYDLVQSINLVKMPFNILWDIGRCYFDRDGFHLKKDYSNIDEIKNLDCSNVLNWVNANWCPSFLVMSDKDIICGGQGDLLKAKLDEAGVENRTFHSTKFADNHCFHLNLWTKTTKNCLKEVLSFMEEKLK